VTLESPPERVILVDEQDQPIGEAGKYAAHENGGQLHRAFSVFVLDHSGNWLLQRRAAGKYHFPLLWTNTCCSHPRPGEDTEKAVHRRLKEEMGFDCPVQKQFHFIYLASCPEGLTEHEFDHVYTGVYSGSISANSKEVAEWRWISVEQLKKELTDQPETFTPWFKIAAAEFFRHTP